MLQQDIDYRYLILIKQAISIRTDFPKNTLDFLYTFSLKDPTLR